MKKIKLVLDAISTDGNIEQIVEGMVKAIQNNNSIIIYIVGPKQEINDILMKLDYNKEQIIIVDASDKITNLDNPLTAIRQKKESSLYKSFQILKENDDIEGFITAGSTGAILCGAIMYLKRITDKRPTLVTQLPGKDEFFCLVDCGANVDCDPEHLRDFATMATVYMQTIYPTRNIRVGLVSNGSEEGKGNKVSKETYELLKNSKLNFVGNIEGNDITNSKCDVLLCDGFVGNVILKNIEGTAKLLINDLINIIKNTQDDNEKKILKKAISKLLAQYDFNSFGGATLLGVNKLIFKGHGTANSDTIYTLINQCYELVNANFIDKLAKTLLQQ